MKAVLVGDIFIPSSMMLTRAMPLRAAGYALQTLDWTCADRQELNQRNLNVELNGPGAELPRQRRLGLGLRLGLRGLFLA